MDTSKLVYDHLCNMLMRIGNEEDAEKVLGFKPGNDVTTVIRACWLSDIFQQMIKKFTKYVVSPGYSASDNGCLPVL